jgi:hypothetical protein
MATKGRGGDSMLVHMTPGEVQALQTLAERHGGTLTINPDTGQPEANFLKKMLPMIAGAALNFFVPGLGAAVGGAFGLGAAAGTGIAVGGISALATGSLSRGLMAGLGAYGGASLVGGLQNLGATAVAPEAMAAANASADPIMSLTAAKEAATAAGIAPAAGAEAAKQGLSMAANNPKSFMTAMGGPAKTLGAAYAAATPMMADQMVPTTTQMPDTGPSYIRAFDVDPYTQRMQALKPIDASTIRLPKQNFAGGGIVALAAGGTAPAYFAANPDVAAAFEANNYGMSPEQFAQTHYEKYGAGEQRAAPNPAVSDEGVRGYLNARPGLSDIQIQQAMDQHGVSAEQMARATGVGFADVQDRYELAKDINAFSQTSPNLTDLQFAQYAVARDPGTFDPVSMAQLARATGVPLDQVMQRYSAVQHGLLVPEDDASAAQKYLRENKDVFDWTRSQEGRDYMRTHALTSEDIAFTHFNRYGSNEGRKWGASAPATTTTTTTTTPQTSAPAGTTNPYGNATNPGDLTRNADGSITVQPNIPGRPYGGFSGMQEVKDAYTAGGGSLGYTPYAPATLQEFQDRYTNTGGSKQAYDYLMNKGEADVKRPITKTGELMLPYHEVMGLRRPDPIPMRRKPDEKKEEAVFVDGSIGGADGGLMPKRMALGGLGSLAGGGQAGYNLGGYSDGGRLLRGPGDGVSDSIPATIGDRQPARLADGEFVVPARIVSELGNGSTEAGARKLYAMMDRVQKARGKTTGKNRVAANTRSEKYLPA